MNLRSMASVSTTPMAAPAVAPAVATPAMCAAEVVIAIAASLPTGCVVSGHPLSRLPTGDTTANFTGVCGAYTRQTGNVRGDPVRVLGVPGP